MSNAEMDVSIIIPEPKDDGRAAKLSLRNGQWHSYPFFGAASKMAQAIDDPCKLVRRSKAVARRYGTDNSAWGPFADRLQDLGFTSKQIEQIASFR